jgi:hypothetical protein
LIFTGTAKIPMTGTLGGDRKRLLNRLVTDP